MPVLVDTMDNLAEKTFQAWPERIYLVSNEGQILHQGGKGPYGFNPEEILELLTSLP